jgi:PncC family amidohydrolase
VQLGVPESGFGTNIRRLTMTLAERLGEALRGRRWTISTVESCTAGGLAYRLTEVPGASAYFLGSVVAYDNRTKAEWVGVPERIFARHGAVSSEAASAMARNGRARFHTDICLAITGIAGPGGGATEKPVGTVFISASGRTETRTERFHFEGDRERVRQSAIDAALKMALALLADG